MNNILFLLYGIIFSCIWFIFNTYFKDFKDVKYDNILPINKENFNTAKQYLKDLFNLTKNDTQLDKYKNEDINLKNTNGKYDANLDLYYVLLGKPHQDFRKQILENNNKKNVNLIKPFNNIYDYFQINKSKNLKDNLLYNFI